MGLKTKDFDKLFNTLASNTWEFFPEKNRLAVTKQLFWDKLKGYSFKQIYKAFNRILDDKDVRYFPMISKVVASIERETESDNYKKVKPHISIDNRGHRLFKRMVKQARYIIEKYGSDRLMLVKCGIKYESMNRKLNGKSGISSINYHGMIYTLKNGNITEGIYDAVSVTQYTG